MTSTTSGCGPSSSFMRRDIAQMEKCKNWPRIREIFIVDRRRMGPNWIGPLDRRRAAFVDELTPLCRSPQLQLQRWRRRRRRRQQNSNPLSVRSEMSITSQPPSHSSAELNLGQFARERNEKEGWKVKKSQLPRSDAVQQSVDWRNEIERAADIGHRGHRLSFQHRKTKR